MRYTLVVVLGMLVSTSSLTTGTIESRLELVESQSNKYQHELAEMKSELLAARTDIHVARSDLAETRSDIAETLSELAETRTDLAQTRQHLCHALHALAGKPGLHSKSNACEISAHNIQRRDAPDQRGDNSQDDISLSLHDLMPLLSSRCKDGRDGKDGKDGNNGINGIDGKDGKDGINGINGKDGRDGRDGIPGVQGVPGTPGLRGSPGLSVNSTIARDGLPGPKGARGYTGTPGVGGVPGVAGTPGVAGPPGPPGTSPEAGSVYTRWGRTSCDGDSTLMYQGFAAASPYGQSGNGVNYQCLHLEPEYNNVHSGAEFSVISGTEFQTFSFGLFPDSASQQNVPCARCYTSRSAVVMIPSRRTCNYGWTKEFEGYLMTEHGTHAHPATYECVDQNPEYISGQSANTNGALFHFVIPDCDGAGTTGHCPPYDVNKQLTCVVCSK